MRFVDVVQGTPEWIRWRTQGIGGADAPAIVGLSRYRTAQRVWEMKCGLRPYPSRDEVTRGRLLEPRIRARYEAATGFVAEPRCCQHDNETFLRASLDGWVDSESLPVEYKAPGRQDHLDALDEIIPSGHAVQCMHILLVTGAPRLHYVSFQDQFPAPRDLVILELTRDEALLGELLALERTFWESVQRASPPRTRKLRLNRGDLARHVTRIGPRGLSGIERSTNSS